MTEFYVEAPTEPRADLSQTALTVSMVEKVYGSRGSITQALQGISFNVAEGEFVAIMGPSGSGKTTLLNCIATIDRPTRGTITVGSKNVTAMNRRQLAAFRRNDLGFIFQEANLLSTLTGFENIALSLTIRRRPSASITSAVQSIAEVLGVSEELKKYPAEMSGGQRQRLAAARAIIAHPALVLADEPTGALDSRNALVMLETLERMNRLIHATILMVTHDAFAASFTQRVLFLKDGKLFNELRRGATDRETFFSRIMEVITFLSGDVGSTNPLTTHSGQTIGANGFIEAGGRHDL